MLTVLEDSKAAFMGELFPGIVDLRGATAISGACSTPLHNVILATAGTEALECMPNAFAGDVIPGIVCLNLTLHVLYTYHVSVVMT